MEFKFYKLLQYHLICKTILQHYCKIVCNQIKHVFYILMVKYLNICVGIRASALGLQMPNVRRIWHFKPQSTQHLELQNPSIANFFAILLQCNSKCRIALQQYCKYIYIYIYIQLLFPGISLSSLSLFMFSSLFSFSFSHLLSPLFKPKPHPPPNINITHHSGGNIGGNVDAVIDTSGFHKKKKKIYIYIYIFSLL